MGDGIFNIKKKLQHIFTTRSKLISIVNCIIKKKNTSQKQNQAGLPQDCKCLRQNKKLQSISQKHQSQLVPKSTARECFVKFSSNVCSVKKRYRTQNYCTIVLGFFFYGTDVTTANLHSQSIFFCKLMIEQDSDF